MGDLLGGLFFWGMLAFLVLVAVGAVVALVAILVAVVRGARRTSAAGRQ